MFRTRPYNRSPAPKVNDHSLWPLFHTYVNMISESLAGGRDIRSRRDVEICVKEGMGSARSIMAWIKNSNRGRISSYGEKESIRNFEKCLREALTEVLEDNLENFNSKRYATGSSSQYQSFPAAWKWVY
ncbi:hypothetical protein TRICI_004841 [Trichomonascus ciferrii]|uniref:Uncharacterized protein n=1 Tax=Trichomonascus ciferrii TaxID=44093 RepID=A0A642UYP4_9ASCO|nr:hypothetical protein TRICI_004841 [Trichomonascus ciferrii]